MARENVSLLHENLVLLDYESEDDRETLLTNLAGILQREGYVKESYLEAILTRGTGVSNGLIYSGDKSCYPSCSTTARKSSGNFSSEIKIPGDV